MRQQIIDALYKICDRKSKAVKDSFPSIFSQNDVSILIQSLCIDLENEIGELVPEKIVPQPEFDLNGLQDELERMVSEEVNSFDFHVYVDYDTAQFSLSGNEISLDQIDIDTRRLEKDLKEIINDNIEAIFTNHKPINQWKQ